MPWFGVFTLFLLFGGETAEAFAAAPAAPGQSGIAPGRVGERGRLSERFRD